MKSSGWTAAGAAFALASGVWLSAQQQLPGEPARKFGASITGAFEGWFDNQDGSHTFLVGYLNRNRGQAVDVPIGPNNRIEPGNPDQGQPTHFLPGRHTGVFVVTVPKEFTPQQRLTWTITVNGQTTSIPFRLHTDYNVSPFVLAAIKNTPPVLRFEEGGASVQGPIGMVSKPLLTRTASVGKPLPLSFWTDDDATYSTGTGSPLRGNPSPVNVTWAKFRGPGAVTFEKAKPEIEKLVGGGPNTPFKGKGATTASFKEPGEYFLLATANDYSGEGGGGEICCWTTAIVKVTVTP
jgi:hypothetical protein